MSDDSEIKKDDLYGDAVKITLEAQRGSVSLLQRRLGIGYARGSRLIEMMIEEGLVGGYEGSQVRKVLVTIEEYNSRGKTG